MNTIPIHSRVALKNGVEDVYALAVPGTEGWVRDHKIDDDGFAMVAIEWDKDHWRFNGQPDGWTFADHFKVIGTPDPPMEQGSMSDDELLDPRPSDEQIEMYIDTISDAMDTAAESDGFFMLAVRSMPNPDNPSETVFVPTVIMQALTQEAEIILDVQLMDCANTTYQQIALSLLERFRRGK